MPDPVKPDGQSNTAAAPTTTPVQESAGTPPTTETAAAQQAEAQDVPSLIGEPEKAPAAAPTDGTDKKQEPKGEKAPEDPYATLEKPADIPVADSDWTGFKETAGKLKLTTEQAAELVRYQAEKTRAAMAAQIAEFKAKRAAQQTALKADPKLQENLGYARAAMRRFGDKGLTDLLAGPLGDDPSVLAFLAKVGKATGEDTPVQSAGGGGRGRDAASILYPTMKT